jgi:dihydroorotate dehydrogenase
VYAFVRAVLFLFPAEAVHHFAFAALRMVMALPLVGGVVRRALKPPPRVAVRAMGMTFPSPLGLAAGFDKNAIGYNALSDLGFGFVEVGTVTGEAQPGNPKPRLFRVKQDRALINRMGFNNAGAAAMRERLLGPRRTIVGVNIGKTKLVSEEDAIADYVKSTRLVGPHADYLVVNVSSPNTPGLRNLQAVEKLKPLLSAVGQALREVSDKPVPLLVKIAPDLSDEDVDAVADLSLELGLAGIIATNTTIGRDGLNTSKEDLDAMGAGGLSGAPLKERALSVLRRLNSRVGDKLTLVSAGGIESPADVEARLDAGAKLVQVYTAFVYEGPLVPRRINDALASRAAH